MRRRANEAGGGVMSWGRTGARLILQRVSLWLAGAGVLLTGCESGPTTPQPTVIVRAFDSEPAWSHDGKTFAFARAETTSFGPPGIYLLDYPVGAPRFLLATNPEELKRLAFAPDDQSLIVGLGGFVLRISIRDGGYEFIFVQTGLAALPQLSRSGQALAYVRPFGSEGSLWIFNMETERDTVFKSNGAPAYATHPSWGPEDSVLAVAEVDGIFILPSHGGPPRRLTRTGADEFHDVPRWIGPSTLLFNRERGNTVTHQLIDLQTGNLTSVPDGLGTSEAVSPSGDSIVVVAPEPAAGLSPRAVLYVRAVKGDLQGARQLTFPEQRIIGGTP